jgi:hypothetical protein
LHICIFARTAHEVKVQHALHTRHTSNQSPYVAKDSMPLQAVCIGKVTRIRVNALAAHLDRIKLEVIEDRLRVLAEELPEGVWGCGLLPHGDS